MANGSQVPETCKEPGVVGLVSDCDDLEILLAVCWNMHSKYCQHAMVLWMYNVDIANGLDNTLRVVIVEQKWSAIFLQYTWHNCIATV